MRFWFQCILFIVMMSASVVHAGEHVTYYINDPLGSPVAALDEQGNVLWRETYRPYGERQNKSSASQYDEQFYTGKQEEPDLGLIYFGARWYDPDTGRFASIDPVGVKEGNIHSFNRYAYANNNPYKFVDPDGRETKVIINNNTPLIGTHVGLLIARDDQNLLWDPAGSYENETRGSGGFFEGMEANLENYVQFQKEDGPDVQVYTFNTTKEQEKEIISNIDRIGDPRGISCAKSVSAAIKGVGPFRSVEKVRTPRGLKNEITEIKDTKK